eukprot:1621066-Rhodomonas_salina.1
MDTGMLLRYQSTLSAYRHARRCPVLTRRTGLPGAGRGGGRERGDAGREREGGCEERGEPRA